MNRGSLPVNPYPGLRPFQEQDEALFFGRDSQIDQLLQRLRQNRFVAVVGTSGSGKSSLVRAGLVPTLHGGFMVTGAGSQWRTVITRPGSSPVANLAEALCAAGAVRYDEADERVQAGLARAVLHSSALGLVEIIHQARGNAGENILIIVDQFEELFRFQRAAVTSAKADEAVGFVRMLLTAASHADASIYVLLTMRSDFLGDCARFHDLPEAINNGLFLVPRLNRDQLREAIDGPVAVAGAEITARLVNKLLDDVGDDPNQLPPLQHALMRTFDIWAERAEPSQPLDLEHYAATGELRSALSQHGEEIYWSLGSDAPGQAQPTAQGGASARRTAERLFKALTERGSDGRRVRRPTSLSECLAVTAAPREELLAVVGKFRERRASFLMPPPDLELDDDSVLDISHESLMENWDRMRAWVDSEAESMQLYQRLASAADQHVKRQAALWRDPELATALSWHAEQRPTEGWAARYRGRLDRSLGFLAASRLERASRSYSTALQILLAIFVVTALAAIQIDKYDLPPIATAIEQLMTRGIIAAVVIAAIAWCVSRIRLRRIVGTLRNEERTVSIVPDRVQHGLPRA